MALGTADGSVAHLGCLVGMGEEQPQRGRDEPGGGVVAGQQDEHDHGQELVARQVLAVLFGGQEPRDQVVAGMPPALVDQVGGVGQELVGGTARGRQQVELER